MQLPIFPSTNPHSPALFQAFCCQIWSVDSCFWPDAFQFLTGFMAGNSNCCVGLRLRLTFSPHWRSPRRELSFIGHLRQEHLILMAYLYFKPMQLQSRRAVFSAWKLWEPRSRGTGNRQTNRQTENSSKDRQPAQAGWQGGCVSGGWYRFLVAIAVATGNRRDVVPCHWGSLKFVCQLFAAY